jgi:hypothetical protein
MFRYGKELRKTKNEFEAEFDSNANGIVFGVVNYRSLKRQPKIEPLAHLAAH